MVKNKRYLMPELTEDIKEKMVFVGGPRQVGKTTMVRHIASEHFQHPFYVNWDNPLHRKDVMKVTFPGDMDLLILDEIHKYRPWKGLVKGIFDTAEERFRIFVTGSAKLDVFRRGGDSLQGRYHYYRLHPFSVAEACNRKWSGEVLQELDFPLATSEIREACFALLTYGGFPEPFIKQSSRTLRRWQLERVERLVKEDIRDLESIRDISLLQVLTSLLPERAASPLSINSLREDLQLAHKTVDNWMSALERMYYHFTVSPFASSSIRSLRKEKKLYLWDWSEVAEPGHRLENLVASHLLKFVNYLADYDGQPAELFCLRDKERREVDFLVTIRRRPWFAVEVKSADKVPSPFLYYFRERLKVPFSYQVVDIEGVDSVKEGVRVISANRFLAGLV